MPDQLYFTSKNEWRQWLVENHDQPDPVWLLFFKKKTGKPTLNYDEAVEQALCFGWIDGVVKGINQESFVRKFMPRKNYYNWSESNRKRVEKLILENEMTEYGLLKIGDYASTGQITWPIVDKETPGAFSDDLFEILKANQQALINFKNLSPSHQKRYIQWVMSAKKRETRINRMNEAVTLLYKNQKNLMK